jgi:hypothetical protein
LRASAYYKPGLIVDQEVSAVKICREHQGSRLIKP